MLTALLAAALTAAPALDDPRDEFWNRLRALCESAAAGQVLQIPPGDTQLAMDARLVVHFWECGETELRFPLHVDENRSRTWVFIRHADHLELRHDHRNADGIEQANTWYGGTNVAAGTSERQEFVTVRGETSGGWAVEILPGQRFTYGTIRNGAWRHHLQFDLTAPVAIPPRHWGFETRPSQRP